MSGELLRRAAAQGDAEGVKHLLSNGANPCATDDYDVTALHAAAWSGHLRCVQFLAVNPWGRDGKGQRRSCLDMQTVKGLTALHLAVQGGESVEEVVSVLLCCGADPELSDYEGKTPLDMAIDLERPQRQLSALRGEALDEDSMERYRSSVAQQFRIKRAHEGAKGGSKGARIAARPAGLMMHEHEIRSFAEVNAASNTGRQGIRNLQIAEEQALINLRRRTKLAHSALAAHGCSAEFSSLSAQL